MVNNTPPLIPLHSEMFAVQPLSQGLTFIEGDDILSIKINLGIILAKPFKIVKLHRVIVGSVR